MWWIIGLILGGGLFAVAAIFVIACLILSGRCAEMEEIESEIDFPEMNRLENREN